MACGVDRLRGAPGAPVGHGEALEQGGGAARLGLLVDHLERGAQQAGRALAVARGDERVARAMQQRDLVQAGHLGGVGDAVPQLEGALEQRGGLAEGVDGLGRRGGAHARAQRVALVAGRGVVMGDAGGDLRTVGTVAGAALERGGEGAVQLGALARQEVVGDDLAQERVAEGVAVVGLGDDEVAGDGLAQCGHERARGPSR